MGEKRCLLICPVCGSRDIHMAAGGMMGYVYHCYECGYQGPLVLEANEEMAHILEEEHRRGAGDQGENGEAPVA